MRTRYADIKPYTTLDGSVIRELMHPDQHGARQQSLAEALVAPGAATRLHRHLDSEELYHVTAGRGRMILGEASFEIAEGDTVLIPPCVAHRVENLGAEALRILCICSPAYRHEDTELLEISEPGQSTNAAALL